MRPYWSSPRRRPSLPGPVAERPTSSAWRRELRPCRVSGGELSQKDGLEGLWTRASWILPIHLDVCWRGLQTGAIERSRDELEAGVLLRIGADVKDAAEA